MKNTILEIKNLHTYFFTEDSTIKAVEGLNLWVNRGEVLGLVGESASGKTVTAYSILRLIEPPGKIEQGNIFFEGKDLLKLTKQDMQKVRGSLISIVFQEPKSSLNPLYTVGFQIAEMIQAHRKDREKKDVHSQVVELLKKVEIPKPESRIKDYPHSLSGGEAQRVMIAMAIACSPKLLIADEPTTALDVTVQAQIMQLFLKLKEKSQFTLILITHDLRLCSWVADRVAVMYAGRIVELAKSSELFAHPLHPYTKALLSSMPQDKFAKDRFKAIQGQVPDAALKPRGCHFHPRCPIKDEHCTRCHPDFKEIENEHWVSCFKTE